MNKCPDCGKENPEDTHTCIEYERNRADSFEKQLELMLLQIEELKTRIVELEHQSAGRSPWRSNT